VKVYGNKDKVMPMETKLDYAVFFADWQNGLIVEVTGAGNRLYGKSVKGQAENPQGFIIVFADVP
jgi:hypothetical protein